MRITPYLTFSTNTFSKVALMLLLTILVSLTGCTSTAIEVDKQMDTPQPDTPFGITGRAITINCDVLEWEDIEDLVRPYQDENLQMALMHQRQSSGYRLMAAAEQAMADSDAMPQAITLILQAIVEAKC